MKKYGQEQEEKTRIKKADPCAEGQIIYPPVYLHLNFEILSVTRFFFNFEISSLKN